MKTKTKITILGVIFLLACILALWWAFIFRKNDKSGEESVQKEVAVRIGYQQLALYRHVFVAKEKGFFEMSGLNVELINFASANQQLQALLANQIDAAGLSNMNVVLIIENKKPGTLKLGPFLVWEAKSFPDYIIARKDADISKLKDLEGRVIGLHPGSAVKAFSNAVLSPAIDISKCTFIEIRPPTMYDALASKRVDALYCMDPVPTVAIEKGIAEVLLPNPMSKIVPPPTPISAVAFISKSVEEKPFIISKIVKALEESIEYMRNPENSLEIAEIISKYTPISPELALKMNISEYWKMTEVDHDRVQALADKFAEVGAAPAKVDTNNLILMNNVSRQKK